MPFARIGLLLKMPIRALDALAYNAALDSTTTESQVLEKHRLWVPYSHRLLR